MTNARGDAALVMYDGDYAKVVRTRPASSSQWSAPTNFGHIDDIDIDGAGKVTLVKQDDAGLWAIEGQGSTWSEPTLLDPTQAGITLDPSIDVNEDGAAVVAYPGSAASARAVLRRADGTWGEPTVWGPDPDGAWRGIDSPLDAVIDGHGRATVLWGVSSEPSDRLRTASSNDDGQWSAATDLSLLGLHRDVTLKSNESGTVIASWFADTDDPNAPIRQFAEKAPGASFGSASALPETGALAIGPHHVARLKVVTEYSGEWPVARQLLASRRAIGSETWSPWVTVADVVLREEGLGAPHLIPDPDGSFVVTWLGNGISSRRLWEAGSSGHAARIQLVPPQPEGFSSNITLRTPSYLVALDGRGALAMWATTYFDQSAGPQDNVFLATYQPSLGPVPTAVMTAPGNPFASTRTVSSAWRGSGSGIAHYVVERRTASGARAWSPYTRWQATNDRQRSFTGARGASYCLRVRAVDVHGRVSGPSAQRCTAVPLDERDFSRSPGWTAGRRSAAYERTVLSTSRKGARLSKTVTAKRVTLRARKCPSCGSVVLLLDGRRVAAVSLRTARHAGLVRIPVPTFSGLRTGVLRVEVTSSRRLVEIDSIGVSRS